MIPDLFILIGAWFLQAVAGLLSALNYIPPIAALFSSINYFLSFTAYFYGVLDVARIYTDAGLIIGFEVFWFGFLIVWYVIGIFRGMLSVGGTPNQ
jgi:hypothetical protein